MPAAPSISSASLSDTDTENEHYSPARLEAGSASSTASEANAARIRSLKEEDEVNRMLSQGVEYNWKGDVPSMGGGRPFPPLLPDREAYRVEFDNDDPMNPHNWTMKRQIWQAVMAAFPTVVATFGSSSFSPGTEGFEEHFGVGKEVGSIAICLYVLGFASGPILWGPLSEQFGRKMPSALGIFLFTCFEFAQATCKDVQTLMLTRFFAGVSSAAPLAISPATYGDLFPVQTRGYAMAIFALCVFGGPLLGPVVGGFIANSFLGWRWTLYITGIMAALSLITYIALAEESYHPVVLAGKAREIRKRTGNWGVYAPHEQLELDIKHIATVSVARPMKMLFIEPILFLFSVYSGFIYGLLYGLLSAIPIIFGELYGFRGGVIMLPYLALFVGCMVATLVNVFIFEPKFFKDLKKSGLPICPEARLPTMMTGAIAFTVGIFWMCWTGAYPKTPEHPHGCHWMVPCVGGSFIGYGLISIFLPLVSYLVDAYITLAASAMSAKTFCRSLMGAVFPLFASQMFHNLGVQWAGTLLGCLSALMLPTPYIFNMYGAKIRAKSKYAINLEGLSEDELKNVKPAAH